MISKASQMAATALGLLTITACSGGSGPAVAALPSAQPSATVSASPSLDARAIAAAAALEAYRGYRRAQVAAEAVADMTYPGLSTYAGDKALARERSNLFQLARDKIVMTGQPIFRPQVSNVVLTGDPSVTISDCVDNGTWAPVHQATGKSAAAPNQPMTVQTTALLRNYNQRWVVVELTSDRSRPC